MTPKLVYFDAVGYAKCVRYMLHYAGVKFEDVRYVVKEWPIIDRGQGLIMTPKLVYFDVVGYAECVRYMLHYAGVKFEDVRYNLKDWPIKEVKDSLAYGILPIYEKDGETINQSMAIARYVASQTGLLPADPWEQAKLDAAVLNIYDFYKKLYAGNSEQDPEKKKALKEEAIEFFFSRFEKDLKAGNGYFGGQLSWADFVLAATVLMMNRHTETPVEKGYPTVEALASEITSLPGVKEYILTTTKPSE